MERLRYPVFLIHGTGYRDKVKLGYWGRIPKLLESHGIEILHSDQDTWGTIERNAGTLGKQLHDFVQETGCGKVNIFAHSKGGLDTRYMATVLKYSPLIASITTISTPHHGSKTIDVVFKFPKVLIRGIGVLVNGFFRLLGDKEPDFYEVCRQFKTDNMVKFNREVPDADGVYYQSYSAAMKSPFSDVIMMIPNAIVRIFDGKNDGLVSSTSGQWTNFKGIWEGATLRGISHMDAVDARRHAFTRKKSETGVTDILNCYIAILEELQEAGL